MRSATRRKPRLYERSQAADMQPTRRGSFGGFYFLTGMPPFSERKGGQHSQNRFDFASESHLIGGAFRARISEGIHYGR